MEGNACYRFATIRNYIELTRTDAVRITIDVGANVGRITRMMKEYFPDAAVYAYEPVPEYRRLAEANTAGLTKVTVLQEAVTGQHLFEDALGQRPRAAISQLRLLKGTPDGGPGWIGGSVVVPDDSVGATAPVGYLLSDEAVRPVSLDEVVARVLTLESANAIDVLKMDCEGCEQSALGTAAAETLARIRYIVGEYHQIDRFYDVVEGKLYATHKVNLVGDRHLGAFFAERLDGTADGILKYEKRGMRIPRPWLSARPLDWHLFDDRYVPPSERRWHGLA